MAVSDTARGGPSPSSETAASPYLSLDGSVRVRRYVLRRTVREFGADQCPDLAASLTFHSVLSIFPALIALVSSLGITGQGRQATATLLAVVGNVIPASALNAVRGPLDRNRAHTHVSVLDLGIERLPELLL